MTEYSNIMVTERIGKDKSGRDGFICVLDGETVVLQPTRIDRIQADIIKRHHQVSYLPMADLLPETVKARALYSTMSPLNKKLAVNWHSANVDFSFRESDLSERVEFAGQSLLVFTLRCAETLKDLALKGGVLEVSNNAKLERFTKGTSAAEWLKFRAKVSFLPPGEISRLNKKAIDQMTAITEFVNRSIAELDAE